MNSSFLSANESYTRSSLSKKQITHFFIANGDATIAHLCKETALSIPTVTKLLGELIQEGYVMEHGKLVTGGGRKPSTYGLNPESGYFVGVDLLRHGITIGVLDFKGNMVCIEEDIPYTLENTPEGLNNLCKIIDNFIDTLSFPRNKVLALCVNIAGRVNPITGYSHTLFMFEERPLADVLEERLGLPSFIENDTRAMTYGEFIEGVAKGKKNVLFLNLSWGLGMGMIINGQIYYGHSGFSGELGHFCFVQNEVLCHCGKKGCLETEVSGLALYRKIIEKIHAGHNSVLLPIYEENGDLTFANILEAIDKEDVLCIEIIEEMGALLGWALAGMLNIFNPELVIIGGPLAAAGDYLSLPLRTSTKKYSLNLANKDTTLKFSKLKNHAGVIGACHLCRNKMLGMVDYGS